MRIALLLVLMLSTAISALAEDATKNEVKPTSNETTLNSTVDNFAKLAIPVTSKLKLSIYGIVKLDYAYNSVNLGQSGSLTPGSGGVPKTGSSAGRQRQSIFTARQSRIGIKVEGPTFWGAKTNALIETDFYGDPAAPTESPQVRMRLAYGSMDWTNTSVQFGQYWDVFGPMVANTIDFRQGSSFGTPNTPRVPQIRITQKYNLNDNNAFKLVLGVQDPSQNGNNSGAATAVSKNVGDMVNVAGQIMWISKILGVSPGFYGLSMNPMTIGVFGLYGNQKVEISSANDKRVPSWGYGFYTFLPILKSKDGVSRAMTLSFEGQAYIAANMASSYATSQNIVGLNKSPSTAKCYGIAAQLYFYPTQNMGLSTGYLRRGAYNSSDYKLNTDGTTNNYQKYNQEFFINVAYDFNSAIRIAAEYQNITTHYGNPVVGSTTFLNSSSNSGSANIGRLAVYYFF